MVQNDQAAKYINHEKMSIKRCEIIYFKIKVILIIIYFRWNNVICHGQVQFKKSGIITIKVLFN